MEDFKSRKLFTYVIDIDDTISITPRKDGVGLYNQAEPIKPVIQKIQELKKSGHTIILFTARGMRTFNNDVTKIEDFHKETLVNWLEKNSVPYDQLIFGKPWGPNVVYVDDRSLTIDQFISFPEKNTETFLKLNKQKISNVH